MEQPVPRRDRGSRFLACAPTFGQRLDQVLADACDRLGSRLVAPVVYTQAASGAARSFRLAGGGPVLRPFLDAADVVIVAVRAVSRVAVYWDWRYAYTYAGPAGFGPPDCPTSLDEELFLHALPPAATVMDQFADQVVDLAPPPAL